MVTSDITKFPHYIEKLERDKQQGPPKSYEEQMNIYESMQPSYQQLLSKPIKEIVDLEREVFDFEEKIKTHKLQIQKLKEEKK